MEAFHLPWKYQARDWKAKCCKKGRDRKQVCSRVSLHNWCLEKTATKGSSTWQQICSWIFSYNTSFWPKLMKSPSLYTFCVPVLVTWEIICQNQISWCTILFHANNACPSMCPTKTLRHMAMSMKSSQAIYYPCCQEEAEFNCWNCFSIKDRGKKLEHHALALEIPAGRPLCKKE